MKTRPLAFAALLVLIPLTPALAAVGDAQVQASMTFHGASVKLDHVRIVRYGNEEGFSREPELRIFLSDRDIPLSVAGLADMLSTSEYLRHGHFNGVMITADPAGHKLSGEVQLLNAPGMGEAGIAGLSTNLTYSQLRVSDALVSGTAALDGGGDDDIKLALTFSAPIEANPVTADLKAAAAQASAPALAMVACSRAMRSGDAAELAKYDTAARNQAMVDMRAQGGEQAFREAMADVPSAESVAKSVKQVVVRGHSATVRLTDGIIANIVWEGGGWKCD
jgi:hypothetical protein